MILVDTNVLLDVALRRIPDFEESAALLDAIERSEQEMCVSWHSIATTYYLIERDLGRANALDFVSQLAEVANIPATGTASFQIALSVSLEDFEDAMQVAAAMVCDADYIVTRNLNDFQNSPIPAYSPEEALNMLR